MNDVRPMMPKAREDRLIIKELPDETLVYDLDTDKAHCLNSTAAVVWKCCDGETSVLEIRESLEENLGTRIDDAVIWLALNQLEESNLLEERVTASIGFRDLPRRRIMRTLSAAIALPIIATIVTPTAVQAQSCLSTGGGPCKNVAGAIPCCTGCNCTGSGGGTCTGTC